jgi:hypothetical protein
MTGKTYVVELETSEVVLLLSIDEELSEEDSTDDVEETIAEDEVDVITSTDELGTDELVSGGAGSC